MTGRPVDGRPSDHDSERRSGVGPTVRRSRTWLLLAAAVAAVVPLAISSPAGAHDDIAGSNPPNRARLDDPISSVEIDFGIGISESVEMFLVYDVGDGETFDDIGGTTTKTGDTTARLEFPLLEREGTYFVKYLAPVPTDGHVLEGAISFTWGEPSGGDDGGFPILPFAGLAIVILGVGAWFTYRRMLVDDDHDLDEPAAVDA